MVLRLGLIKTSLIKGTVSEKTVKLSNMTAILPEFQVNISQKRKTAVIDPALALSPYGIPLVRRLAETMELWMPKTFWNILDNTHFYLCRPEALNENLQACETPVWQNGEAIFQTLQEWERIRVETDPASMKLFWIGDGPGESIHPSFCVSRP